MTDLVLATRSTHKIKEIRTILEMVPKLRVLDLIEAGVSYDDAEEDLEPYDTFEENAASKAAYFQKITGVPTVAHGPPRSREPRSLSGVRSTDW